MNTSMKEPNINELEQVNGGILPIIVVGMILAGGAGAAVGMGFLGRLIDDD